MGKEENMTSKTGIFLSTTRSNTAGACGERGAKSTAHGRGRERIKKKKEGSSIFLFDAKRDGRKGIDQPRRRSSKESGERKSGHVLPFMGD